MKQILQPEAVRPTRETMQMLEDKGLIHRLCPGHDTHNPPLGEIEFSELYASDRKFGPHRIISVTINRMEFSAFGTHSDHEEFLLIGREDTKPLYLLIALLEESELSQRIAAETLTADDFLLLDLVFNDPELSFFTMKKGVPHGEATSGGDGIPPTFYVTEPQDLDLIPTNFAEYGIEVL